MRVYASLDTNDRRNEALNQVGVRNRLVLFIHFRDSPNRSLPHYAKTGQWNPGKPQKRSRKT